VNDGEPNLSFFIANEAAQLQGETKQVLRGRESPRLAGPLA
jgi:hypothetical protein